MKKTKKTKNIYYDAITYENIYKMWKIIKKTCKNRKDVFYFSLNVNTNIYSIYNDLKNKTYKPNKYRTFMIFEPKPRLVMSQTIRDKIVNHFVTNFYLIPYLENKLIDSNVATRKNKGGSYAMKLLKKYFNKLQYENDNEIYCLKLDVKKYFYTIDQEILIKHLKKEIYDNNVIELLKMLIAQTNKDYINEAIEHYNAKYNLDIPFYKYNKGLSIGAMTSQFLAIYYLNDIDHYIKENLQCKYYVRYMDDFLILDKNKNRLKELKVIIENKLNELKLNINYKSNIYRCTKGFSFLGFKYKIVNNKLNISFCKKTYIKIIKKLNIQKKTDKYKYIKSYASYYGYFKTIYHYGKGDFKMKQKEIYELYKNKYPYHLIIIKEGIFFKSYNEDAIILWNLFNYKLNSNSISFGSTPYTKVIETLKELDLSFLICSKEGELLKFSKEKDIYISHKTISSKKHEKINNERLLIDKLKEILKKDSNKYYDINNILDSYLEELNLEI